MRAWTLATAALVAGCGSASVAASDGAPQDTRVDAAADVARDTPRVTDAVAAADADPCTSGASATGCPCAPGEPPAPCDVATDTDRGPDGVCHLGQRVCRDGRWSRCEAWGERFRYVGPISECPGSCLFGCRHQVLCAEPGDALPEDATGLVVGDLPSAVFCPRGTARGGLTLACGAEGCQPGVLRRRFLGECRGAGTSPDFVPVWGRLNITSSAPPCTRIRFEVRAADTLSGLATAPVVRVPDAPVGTPEAPTSLDLRPLLRLANPLAGLEYRRHLELTVYLEPAAHDAVAPTLGSLEVQWTCDSQPLRACRAGAPCVLDAPCRRGVVTCEPVSGGGAVSAVCRDAGPALAGTWCGAGMACTASGACAPCDAGR